MIIKHLPQSPYTSVWDEMKRFTLERSAATEDELWLLEHDAVYTQGLAGKPEHVLNPHGIPIVQSDRGGQVTYHGPGQLMAYTLFDLKRLGLNTRCFVAELENTVIDLLAEYNIQARGDRDAPGVYVDDAKICSIGLRVKKDCAYHGIALNVNMDLSPFKGINPCGFAELPMTQIADFVPLVTMDDVTTRLTHQFQKHFIPRNHL